MSRTFRRRNAGKKDKARDGRPHDYKCRCEWCEETRKYGLDLRRRDAADREMRSYYGDDCDEG